jgi:hypothetical protein
MSDPQECLNLAAQFAQKAMDLRGQAHSYRPSDHFDRDSCLLDAQLCATLALYWQQAARLAAGR